MITTDQAQQLLSGGGDVVDTEGKKMGSIGQVFLDDQTGQPEWVTVKTGMFGGAESFVPLREAEVDGADVRVPYDKGTVKDAPRISDPEGHLSEDEEDTLYTHYRIEESTSTESGSDRTAGDASGGGLAGGGGMGGDGRAAAGGMAVGGMAGRGVDGVDDVDATGDTADQSTLGAEAGSAGRGTVGGDVSGPTTDSAMTRSEEQLHVGTETRQTGRARLRKFVVTENVTQTVPVSHEEVRLEREPITEANRGDAVAGGELTSEEHDVTLSEERVVVSKETVPVERVRVDKDTVTGEEQVEESVRSEQIELEEPSDQAVDDSTSSRGGQGSERG